MSIVKHMSDRVMIMREGEIIEIQEADSFTEILKIITQKID